MVDLALLQSVSYMAGALGVFVGALYYVMNLRNAKNDRQASLFMGIYKDMTTSDMPRIITGLMSYTWTDFADFQRKSRARMTDYDCW